MKRWSPIKQSGPFHQSRTHSNNLHCNYRHHVTPNGIDRNTNSNHFTEQLPKLCGFTQSSIEERGQTILFCKKALKTFKTLLMTMWLPWQQSICERYASLRIAVGLMLCYLMCGRAYGVMTVSVPCACLVVCFAVCIISPLCWSCSLLALFWVFFNCGYCSG